MNKLKHFFGLDIDKIDASRYFKANGSFIGLFILILPFIGQDSNSIVKGLVGAFFFIFVVILVLTTIRRLRDIGRSPWWSLLLFTFVNLFFVIYLLGKDGKKSTMSTPH